MTDRFQFGHGWERSRLFTNPANVRQALATAIGEELGVDVPVEWRRVGARRWRSSATADAAATAIVDRSQEQKTAIEIEVRKTGMEGPKLVLRKYVDEPRDPGAIPEVAQASEGTKRCLRYHEEISLAVPEERFLGLYVPRPIKDDIPQGWETGDPWPQGAFASEHAHAAARDCGVDNAAGTDFEKNDQARLDLYLDKITQYVLANYQRLGVVEHIYESKKWVPSGAGPVAQPYNGSDRHETHTHTAFSNHDGAKPAWL
jgi:hypothetical protein